MYLLIEYREDKEENVILVWHEVFPDLTSALADDRTKVIVGYCVGYILKYTIH